MPASRRHSWKTPSHWHNRGNKAVEIDNIAVSQYAKQLNPYKPASNLRGSGQGHSGSITRRPSASDDDLGIDSVDEGLDLGDDDESMCLENILSSIAGIDDNEEVNNSNPPASGGANDESTNLEETNKDGNADNAEELFQDVLDIHCPPPHNNREDCGNGIAHRIETPPIQDTHAVDNVVDISPVSEEDSNTLWTDGDATKEHKIMMAQTGEGPAFASGGFDDNVSRLESMPISGPSFQNGSKGGSSLVDSIIDDLEISDNNNKMVPNIPSVVQERNNSAGLKPPRGRFSTNRHAQLRSQTKQTDSFADKPPYAPENSSVSGESRENKVTTKQKVLGAGAEIHQHQEDETLSAVTDPTESPFIYTYKKSGDDDSVSQITSSLAGHGSGTTHLQNVPMNTGSHIGPNTRNRSGLSWMSNGSTGGGGIAGSRMMQRKGGMVIQGPYGRDRGRKTPKVVSSGGGGRNSRSSSRSGSCGSGSASYDGGKNNLDEIAFALNADCMPGKNQRARQRPSTTGRGGAQFRGNSRGSHEDLSTIASMESNDGKSTTYINANVASNVSRLGMGGVSCGAQSVAETNAVSETTTSSLGMFQSISMFAWKAQHHASRFFFPTSPKVTQRKKFDRSDSLEDILLEEGANTLPHRKQRGARHCDDEDEDEIDYFSRAMSTSHVQHGGGANLRSPKQRRRRKYCWNGSPARNCCLFFMLTVGILWYRMPTGENEAFVPRIEGIRFRVADEQSYDVASNNAMLDSKPHPHDRAEITIPSRLGQPPDPLSSSTEGQQPFVDTQSLVANNLIQLPSTFDALANVDDLLFQKGIDVPFYWHIPRSGGGTINDVLGSCLHLTLAADAGGSEGHGQEEALRVLHFSRQVNYVNVDTSTHLGIARAKNLHLVSSGLADVVISPLLHEASSLFTPTRRGRMFTIFRHPVERAASLFHFIQETQWKQPGTGNDQFAKITIEQFYKKGFAENNWMTRFLTNELSKGELTENDLNIAKEVIRQKCLVGLLEEKGETFERIQKYFGWRPKNEEEQNCLEKKLEWAWPMKHKHPAIEDGSRAWRLISASNQFDLQLYEYAKQLFAQQGQLFHR